MKREEKSRRHWKGRRGINKKNKKKIKKNRMSSFFLQQLFKIFFKINNTPNKLHDNLM